MLVGVLIAVIILTIGFFGHNAILSQTEKITENLKGRVLGVSESWQDNLNNQINILENNSLINQTINEIKKMPLPDLSNLALLGQAANKLPDNQIKGQRIIKIDEANFSASNMAALDCQSGDLIYAKAAEEPHAIASITKLMTAMVFLEHNPGWETIYQINAEDRCEGGIINLFTGEKVKIMDLFYTSLVASDNTATLALIRSTGLTEKEFVALMNQKASELGLAKTKFTDVVGLANANVSTAREVVRFTQAALADDNITKAAATKKYEFSTSQGRKKIITSTNNLLFVFPKDGIEILGGKTGYVEASGYCLVSKFKNGQNQEIITAVLGAATERARFTETQDLTEQLYQAY